MTANELLHLARNLEAAGIDLDIKTIEALEYIANLHSEPEEAGRMYMAEQNEPDPSLSAWERNR